MNDGLEALAAKADSLADLHNGFLVLPNAWDVASARAFEALGYPAVATTSSGVSASLGYADRQQTPVDEMFGAVARIARGVEIPVTADLEGGYGLPAFELVERLLDAGAVGLNIEDTDHTTAARALVDVAEHAGYLGHIMEASRARGVEIVLNARIDVHLRQIGSPDERLSMALDRARRYLDAGAHCVYPIFVNDDATLTELVALGAPVNVLFMPGAPSLEHLREVGVRRVTFGGHLQEASIAAATAFLGDVGAIPPQAPTAVAAS
jgi:2-methylisocitrate lyase-like PEP mutase family enzyme